MAMRRTLVNCASCAQKRPTAATTATASQSQPALASRAHSTRTTTSASCKRVGSTSSSPSPHNQPQSQQLRRSPAAQRKRWLSGSPAVRSQETTPPSKGKEEQSTKKDTGSGSKPLPYYALFPQTLPAGAPPDGPFDIDVRALRREFLQLQAASHPDLHHSASHDTTTTSTTEDSTTPSPSSSSSSSASPSSKNPHSSPRRKAEALSSHINSAYKTLSSPLLRAQYILAERHGVDLAGDEASRITGPADPALLMEVLHARETIEEAASESDLEELSAENDERIGEAVGALGRALEVGDVAGAVGEAVKLKYWENIRESIRNWEGGKPVVLQH